MRLPKHRPDILLLAEFRVPVQELQPVREEAAFWKVWERTPPADTTVWSWTTRRYLFTCGAEQHAPTGSGVARYR